MSDAPTADTRCPECFALLEEEHVEDHASWHAGRDDILDRLESAIDRIGERTR